MATLVFGCQIGEHCCLAVVRKEFANPRWADDWRIAAEARRKASQSYTASQRNTSADNSDESGWQESARLLIEDEEAELQAAKERAQRAAKRSKPAQSKKVAAKSPAISSSSAAPTERAKSPKAPVAAPETSTVESQLRDNAPPQQPASKEASKQENRAESLQPTDQQDAGQSWATQQKITRSPRGGSISILPLPHRGTPPRSSL